MANGFIHNTPGLSRAYGLRAVKLNLFNQKPAQTNRQLEILRLMGVDVWQLRHGQHSLADCPAAVADNPETAVGDRTPREALEWAARSAGNPDSEWLFVCQCDLAEVGDGLISGSARCQLYEALLFSLGLCLEDVFTISVVRQEVIDAGKEPLLPSLESFLARHQPRNFIVMGEQCAQALVKAEKPLAVLRNEKYRYPGSECILRATFSLDWLLEHPLDKAGLWQDLLKAGIPTSHG